MASERETVCRKCGAKLVAKNAPDGVELLLICPDCTGDVPTEYNELACEILDRILGTYSEPDIMAVEEILAARGVVYE